MVVCTFLSLVMPLLIVSGMTGIHPVRQGPISGAAVVVGTLEGSADPTPTTPIASASDGT